MQCQLTSCSARRPDRNGLASWEGFLSRPGRETPGLDKAARQVTDLLDNELATSGS
jgi:hypothetical protein